MLRSELLVIEERGIERDQLPGEHGDINGRAGGTPLVQGKNQVDRMMSPAFRRNLETGLAPPHHAAVLDQIRDDPFVRGTEQS